MRKYNILLFFIITLVALSCREEPRHAIGRSVITVTIEPLRYFTECIAGDKFDVETMVPKGGNPETYEPSARQMINLSKSILYIKVGNIGFERTWMKKLEQNAPHAIVIDSSEGISIMETENGIPDPHTWMSTANSRIIAENIYKALVQLDKKDSAYFKKNLERLIDTIAKVDSKIRSITKDKTKRAFLIYHPILTYYARDFGLQQIPLEEESREPSARQMQNIIRRARQEHVDVFFVQKEFASRNIKAVSESTGAQTVEINPLGYDWQKEMIKVAECLK